jgi:DNA invertase Pin-like site-specific DNA recombinase
VQEAILAQAWAAGGRVFAADAGEILADDADDPMRTAMRQMMGVFAQLERGMIRARMARSKRAAAAPGRYTGGLVPLGQRVEAQADGTGRLVVDDASQAAIARMRELRDAGRLRPARNAEGSSWSWQQYAVSPRRRRGWRVWVWD